VVLDVIKIKASPNQAGLVLKLAKEITGKNYSFSSIQTGA